jgi:mono/diheme cytochrome c family protein
VSGRRRAPRPARSGALAAPWLALVLALAVAAAGCGAGGSAAPPAAATHRPADRFAYARRLLLEICAGCHTLADAGAHGPSSFDNEVIAQIGRRERLGVARGVMSEQGPYMPAWNRWLTPRERRALVAYIVAVAGRPRSGAIVRPDAPVPSYGTGRFAPARALFRQDCGGCHALADAGTHGRRSDLGASSSLAGGAGSLARRRALALRAILDGKGTPGRPGAMPSWRHVLSAAEAERLADYLATVLSR